MCIKQIAVFLCMAIPIVTLAGVHSKPEAHTVGEPPELGVAVVADGHILLIYRFVEHRFTRTISPAGPQPHTEIVPVTATCTTRADARKVVARRVDGRMVPYKVLMKELAKPTPVIFAKKDQQVNPLFAKMFKSESLVLLLSAKGEEEGISPIKVEPSGMPNRNQTR